MRWHTCFSAHIFCTAAGLALDRDFGKSDNAAGEIEPTSAFMRTPYMTAEKQEKIQKLLDDLKEEIFVELDRRVRSTEETLGTQIEEAASRKEIYKKVRGEFRDFQKNFSYHRIPYAATIVVGFMLFWYGMWNILPQLPLLSNGFIAVGAGLVLLFVSGATYKKLVG